MNIFNGNLEPIKSSGFGYLNFMHKSDSEIFKYDTIGCGEKSQNVADEVFFVGVQAGGPVGDVRVEVDFFGGPKGGYGFFVHGPDVVVFYGEEDESVFVFFKEGFD